MRLPIHRWWLWSGVVLLPAGLLGAALVLLPPHSRITKANFMRIRHGMTAAEVQAILGRPPELVLRGPNRPWTSFYAPWYPDAFERLSYPEGKDHSDEEERLYWSDSTLTLEENIIQLGPRPTIELQLDANGRVLYGNFTDWSCPPSLVDRIRSQLHAWGW
jgi:hypothetical protein